MSPFNDKNRPLRILVHGATGGIGSALVKEILEAYPQAKVVGTGRNEAALQSLKDSCVAQGDRLKTFCLDALNEDQLAQLASTLKEELGALDGCIHTIGALHGAGLKPEKSLRDVGLDTLVQSFSTNTVPFLLLAKHFHKLFRHEHPSLLVAISAKVGSIADNRLGGWYSYRVSKAALNMAVSNVSLEYTRTGCKTVTFALHPGTTETHLSKPFLGGYPADQVVQPERTAERILKVLSQVSAEENGSFLNWDGERLPW